MLRKGSKVNTTDVGQSYSATGKLLHWGFIGVFAYGIFKQVDDLNQLEDPGFLRFEFIFACAFLLILALRLWVMRGQGSALPQSAPDWQRVAAKLVHYGMYVALMMIAVTGIKPRKMPATPFPQTIIRALKTGATSTFTSSIAMNRGVIAIEDYFMTTVWIQFGVFNGRLNAATRRHPPSNNMTLLVSSYTNRPDTTPVHPRHRWWCRCRYSRWWLGGGRLVRYTGTGLRHRTGTGTAHGTSADSSDP